MFRTPPLTSTPSESLARLGRKLRNAARGVLGSGWAGSPQADARTPEIDLIDQGDAFVVLADLPGFDMDDLSVDVSDGQLTIRGTSTETAHRSGRYLKQEREGSTMRRTLSLPAPIDAGTVTTDYRRGVMQVVVEKAADTDHQTLQRN